jgi:hypothetical protein
MPPKRTLREGPALFESRGLPSIVSTKLGETHSVAASKRSRETHAIATILVVAAHALKESASRPTAIRNPRRSPLALPE